jgi:hypothetical protein
MIVELKHQKSFSLIIVSLSNCWFLFIGYILSTKTLSYQGLHIQITGLNKNHISHAFVKQCRVNKFMFYPQTFGTHSRSFILYHGYSLGPTSFLCFSVNICSFHGFLLNPVILYSILEGLVLILRFLGHSLSFQSCVTYLQFVIMLVVVKPSKP